MLINTVLYCVVLVLTVVVLWLAYRGSRSPRPLVKWTTVIAGSLFGLVFLLVSGVSTRGMARLYAPRGRALRDLHVERTPERVARGEHIANSWCASCHTLNGKLPLSGGRNLSEDAGIPLGDLYPINLTPAGPLQSWTDGEIFRAVRDGADNNRRRLPVMSAQRVRNLSDDDLESLIAYLHTQPAVVNETPLPRPSFLMVILAGAGKLPLLPTMAPEKITAPPPGPTLEYGKYTVSWMSCAECHGKQLTGGGGGVLPKGPNLRSVKAWTRDQFITAMRTGKTPYRSLDPKLMPWNFVGRLSDDELTSVHLYLTSLQ
jgi:mono/diheme cytochrome c family protein